MSGWTRLTLVIRPQPKAAEIEDLTSSMLAPWVAGTIMLIETPARRGQPGVRRSSSSRSSGARRHELTSSAPRYAR